MDTSNRTTTYVEVTGLSRADLSALSRANLSADEWSALLRVIPRSSASTADRDARAVAGRYAVGDSLRFWPSFPFDAGREYDVRFDPSTVPRVSLSAGLTTATVFIPGAARSPSTRVLGVYPGSDLIPANLLRIYVEFSAAMGQQGERNHLSFVDDTGREIPDLMPPQESDPWNAARTRYTVILDPGRVKREILADRETARALHDGSGITIIVKRDWLDAHGLPLTTEYRRRYRIGPPEEHALSTATWQVTAPAAGSQDALMVTFPKPLDFGLLPRSLSVRRGDSNIEGDGRIGAGEIRWEFIPRSAWQRGTYIITVEPSLEDVAGNRIGRAFVRSRGDAIPAESAVPVLVPFIVR